MATSGTNTFNVTRDDIIKSALRLLGVIGVGESPITEDYENCSQALNIMIKSWAKKGFPLWVYEKLTLPLVVSQTAYEIGPTAGSGGLVMSKPVRIFSAYVRNPEGFDTSLIPISREEYDDLGNKTSQGIPNQFYYDNQLENGVLYLYNVPVLADYTVYILAQRMFDDMTEDVDDFDFPKEWFQALKWGLASELSIEYGVEPEKVSYIDNKAFAFIQESFDFSVEEPSVYFSVDPQFYNNRGR
jgi:hypothetical protein